MPDQPALTEPFQIGRGVEMRTAEDGSPVFCLPGSRMVRVGQDVMGLIDALRDNGGRVDLAVAALGAPWNVEIAARTAGQLEARGILERIPSQEADAGARLRAAPRRARLSFRPPFTVQLSLLDPSRLLARVDPALRFAVHRTVVWPGLGLAAIGVAVLGVDGGGAQQALRDPLPLRGYLALLIALVLVTALHELGHAVALAANGGHPRRMGVMLFYFAPAFFCDVTEAWLLSRAARAKVALAGVFVHVTAAGAAVVVGVAMGPETGAGQTAVAFGACAYTYGLINLLPLVKLDGYLALMGWLDLPYLRDKALTAWHACWMAPAWGTGRPARQAPAWLVLFGLGCAAAPPLLLSYAAVTVAGIVLPSGRVGATILAGLLWALAWVLVRRTARLARVGLAGGAAPWRVLATSTLAVAAATAVVGLVPVPVPGAVRAGWVTTPDGTYVAATSPAAVRALRSGAKVALGGSGVVPGPYDTHADAAAAAERCRVTAAAVLPVRSGDLGTVPAVCHRLTFAAGEAPPLGAGALRVDVVPQPLLDWGWDLVVGPALGAWTSP